MTDPPAKECRRGKRKRAPSLARALRQARGAGAKVRGARVYSQRGLLVRSRQRARAEKSKLATV
jgi:hypothetical protein